MKTVTSLLSLVLASIACTEPLMGQSLSAAAERLLVNGKVFTAEPSRPYAEAVAIRNGTIVGVGSRSEAAAALGPNPETVDLQGYSLLPGFVDSHNHAAQGGGTLSSANLTEEITAMTDLVAFVTEARRSGKGMNGDVLKITGVPLGYWSQIPALEEAFSSGEFAELPLFLSGLDYHTGWANRALRSRAGLTREFVSQLADGARQYYGVRDGSEPNGFVAESGLEQIHAVIPKPSAGQLRDWARAGVKYLNSLGITAWMDPYADASVLGAYRDLARLGELTAHVAALPVVQFPPAEVRSEFDPFIGFDELRKEFSGVTNLSIPGIKVFADGVAEFPTQTAAMSAPYRNSGKRGDLPFAPERFAKTCVAADQRGLIVHVHAIGDRAVTEALNGIEAARKANGPSGPRHSITHLQFVQPADFARFQKLGVIASFQLLWASADAYTIDGIKPYLDPGIYAWQYPARSILQAGATIAGASDWAVSTPDVFQALYQAETRKGPLGVLDPSQRVPREAMLYAYTRNAALAMGQLDRIGSIAPGKEADLVLLDRDILLVSPDELKETRVLWTLVAGRKVYEGR